MPLLAGQLVDGMSPDMATVAVCVGASQTTGPVAAICVVVATAMPDTTTLPETATGWANGMVFTIWAFTEAYTVAPDEVAAITGKVFSF